VLIEVVGAEHRTGLDLVIVSGSILILAIAVLVLRYGSYKLPSAPSAGAFEPAVRRQTAADD
jgi:hypothetical protein